MIIKKKYRYQTIGLISMHIVIMCFDDKFANIAVLEAEDRDEKLLGLLRGRAKSRGDKVTRPCFPVIARSGNEQSLSFLVWKAFRRSAFNHREICI